MASCTFLGLQGWCHRSATRGPFAAHAKCCSKTLLELVGISVETLVKKHSRSMFSAPEHLSGSLLQHGLAAHPSSSSPRLLVWRTPGGCPEDARVRPQELLELLGTRRCILQMLFIRDFHRQRPHGCFYLLGRGGEETGAAQPAVAQMLACLFSLLGVAAPSYEKHGKNSARRGISAYFLPSVTLPASRLERRRVGACRWQRWLRREKALLERRERWAAPAASLVGLPGTSHSSGARYSKPGFLLTPPWAAVSPSLCPPPSPGVIFRGTVAPGGWREAGGPRGALARTERGPG